MSKDIPGGGVSDPTRDRKQSHPPVPGQPVSQANETTRRRDADERLSRFRDDLRRAKASWDNERSLGLAALVVELNAINKWLEDHGKRIASALEGIEINV